MKESHKWVEMVEVRCPYCGYVDRYYGACENGDIVDCHACNNQFQLGE